MSKSNANETVTVADFAPVVAKALKSKDGAHLPTLIEETGLCRRSVRKLIAEAGGKRDGNVWRATAAAKARKTKN